MTNAAQPTDLAGLRDTRSRDPSDHAAWIALAQGEAQAGNPEAAAAALTQARGHFRAAPFVLEKSAEEERALGLDLMSTPTAG